LFVTSCDLVIIAVYMQVFSYLNSLQ